jgi:lysophospholipase L1-like esterase
MGKKRHRRSDSGRSGIGLLTGVGLSVLGVAAIALSVFALQNRGDAAPQTGTYTPPPAASSEPAVEFPRNADGGITAVFLGDSLTYGLYASSEEAGYRPQVVAALNAVAPVTATRGGQTGNTVQTVSDSATIPADAGLVVLALGTNDVWKTDLPTFGEQYSNLVAKVRSSAPDAVIACLGVWANPDGARGYNKPIKSSCDAGNGIYVPISPLFNEEGMRGPAGVEAFGGVSDDFHPNDTGYAAIAAMVNEALQLGQ